MGTSDAKPSANEQGTTRHHKGTRGWQHHAKRTGRNGVARLGHEVRETVRGVC